MSEYIANSGIKVIYNNN